MNWLLEIGYMLLVYAAAIAFHEYGHKIAAVKQGRQATIYFEKYKDRLFPNIVTAWSGFTSEEDEKKIILSGVLLGVIPIALYVLTMDYTGINAIGPLWVVFAYVWASKADLKRIFVLEEG